MGFSERLRLLRNRRYEEWFHIVFAGPVGAYFAATICEIRWITPNMLTWLSAIGRAFCCWFLLEGGWGMNVAAVALIHGTLIVDIMDGSLARYRGVASYEGAFLDKVGDSIALNGVLWAVGYRAYLDTGEVRPLLVAIAIGLAFLARSHMFWLTNFYEAELSGGLTSSDAGKPTPGEMSSGERLRYYAANSYRVFAVMAAEVYLTLSIALLIGEVEWALYGLGVATGGWYLGILVSRILQMRRLDRRRSTGVTK